MGTLVRVIVDFLNWMIESWLHLAIVCGAIAAPLGIGGAYLSDRAEPGTRKYEVGMMFEEVAAPLAAVVVIPIASALIVGAIWLANVWISWIVGLF